MITQRFIRQSVLLAIIFMITSSVVFIPTASAQSTGPTNGANPESQISDPSVFSPYKMFLPIVFKPNRPPVANDQAVTTDMNVSKAITLTATDPENSPLTWSIISYPGHGTLSGTAPYLNFQPSQNYSGSDYFTFQVSDGVNLSNVATVTITILAPPANPIRNGTFEAGRDGNWMESSALGWPIIVNASEMPIPPHGGSWAAWLGGDNYETARLIQTGITLTGVRYLHFWYIIGSEDICGYDFASIYINGALFSTQNLCDSADTGGWVPATFDLGSYTGTTISLEFRVTTDGALNSNFFLDDVTITASSTMNGPVEEPTSNGNESRSKEDYK